MEKSLAFAMEFWLTLRTLKVKVNSIVIDQLFSIAV